MVLSWIQPLCDKCWVRRNGFRLPHRIMEDQRVQERCCDCGMKHRSGIYMRIDPATVDYPS